MKSRFGFSAFPVIALAAMKLILRFLIIGGLLGGVLTTWLAPAVIAWYFQPPAQVEFSCVGPIQWALNRLRMAQLGGIGVGAVIGILVWLYFRPKNHSPVR